MFTQPCESFNVPRQNTGRSGKRRKRRRRRRRWALKVQIARALILPAAATRYKIPTISDKICPRARIFVSTARSERAGGRAGGQAAGVVRVAARVRAAFVSTNGLRRKTQLSRNQSLISHLARVYRASERRAVCVDFSV